MWAYLFLFICALLVMVFVLIIMVQNIRDIPPYFPSGLKNIKKAFAHISLDAKDNFVDLGSGDGRVVFTASKTGATTSGVEINPFLVLFTKLRALLWKTNRPQFYLGSYFNHNLTEYNVVFTYLFPNTMDELEEKIWSELKPGSYVITNTFKFKHHDPIEKFGRVYVYVV